MHDESNSESDLWVLHRAITAKAGGLERQRHPCWFTQGKPGEVEVQNVQIGDVYDLLNNISKIQSPANDPA